MDAQTVLIGMVSRGSDSKSSEIRGPLQGPGRPKSLEELS